MHITMVKKINEDGQPCRKCNDVMGKLERSGQIASIDHITYADERDPSSEGLHLAQQHNVELAPFFIVRDSDGGEKIYTSYLKLVREVLNGKVSQREELMELTERVGSLDYI